MTKTSSKTPGKKVKKSISKKRSGKMASDSKQDNQEGKEDVQLSNPEGEAKKKCGKCNKPKGKEEGCCRCGRPVEYEDRFCHMILDFFNAEAWILTVDKSYHKPTDFHVKMALGKKKIDDEDRDLVKGGLKGEYHKVIANIFPTLERFAATIDVHKDTLNVWATEVYPEDYFEEVKRGQLKHPEFSRAYRMAKQIQEAIFIENGMQGKYNSNFAIFYAKNNLGWEDKVVTEDKSRNPLTDDQMKKIDQLLENNG